jgi:hypothetical protein
MTIGQGGRVGTYLGFPLAARGWPLDGLELVAVNPGEYLNGMPATDG